ncbi:MAG: nitroreductase family protein [Candidatus Binataceae bacterium]
MDALEVILTRRVVRQFAPQPVEIEQLKKIVDAGRHAMSARNLQPWQFVVVRDPDTLRELGGLCTTGRFIANAPAAIVVLKDTRNQRWADTDCAQAVANMADAGWALGLGTCWVGNFDAAAIAARLGVPDNWAIFTVLPFGYPDSGNPPQSKPLKAWRETTHFERFGNSQP